MIFEKERGLLKKKIKVIDEILVDEIKVYKDDVLVKQNKMMVKIQTVNKNITLTCSSVIEARKLVSEIITLKTGAYFIERGTNKINRVVDTTKKVVLTGIGVAIAAKQVYDFIKDKL